MFLICIYINNISVYINDISIYLKKLKFEFIDESIKEEANYAQYSLSF